MKASANVFLKRIVAGVLCFFFLIPFQYIPSFNFISPVEAATNTLTSRVDFQQGTSVHTEATTKEGELKLEGDGTWNARQWRTPYLPLTDGTTFTTDGTYSYMLIGRDTRFVKYIPSQDKWLALARSPHSPSSGADMVVLGDYIYTIFGGYQKKFSRYSISSNVWTDITDLPDLVYSGASIQTDGTYLYIMRGASTTDFWRYNPSTSNWSTLTAPPATISTGADLIFDNSTGTSYLYTPRGANTTTFYRYDITATTWSTMSAAPATLNDNGNITKRGDYIYVLRGSNTNSFYKYRISTDTWSTITNTPQTNRYVGVTYNASEDNIYVFRGNSTYEWWKFDADTEQFLGPSDLPVTPGTGADLIYSGSLIYYRRGNNNSAFYSYNPSNDTWTALTSSSVNFNDDNKGIAAGGNLYYFRGSGTTEFYRYNISGNSWTSMAAAPATVNYGASLAYPGSGDYIYATRGGLTTSFWRYSISGNTWSDASAADLLADNESGYGARLVSDGTNIYAITGNGIARILKYTVATDSWTSLNSVPFSPYYGTDAVYYNGKIYAISGYYKTTLWEYTISTNTWRALPDYAGYYAYDIGSYNGGSIASNGSGTLYQISGQNITRMLTYSISSYNYPSSGTWTSAPLDLSYVSSWSSLSVNSSTPSDSSITLETRSSSDLLNWSSWQTVSGGTIASTAQRYLQIRATLNASTDRTQTPVINDITVSYTGDTTSPINPTSFLGFSQEISGTALTSGNSYHYQHPYFSWSGASDTESTVNGYYIYFGTDASADPQTSGSFQSAPHYLVTEALNTGTYYLRIKTKDSAGNISAAVTGFTYLYSGVSTSTSSYTSTSDFTSGTATNVSITGNEIKLASKNGFWKQERLSLAPAGFSYGSGFAYVSTTNKLYTFRGSNTTTFYEYDIASDVWSTKSVAPATVYQGGEVVEGPSGYLYAIRGSSTATFWRYDIANDTWSDAAAADAPQTFYYGSSLIYDGNRYIYALRGNNDDAFMRYDTQTDSWDTLANTDFGAPTQQVNNNIYVGGDLAFDGNDTMYAIQGNTYTGFASYSISANSWTILPNLPVMPYDGAQIVYDSTSNAVYMIPGWSSPFFYKYDISSETWSVLQDAPASLSAGAVMRNVGGTLYILRGAGTTTFWKYNIAKSSWKIPTLGLFGGEFRGTDYRTFGYGASIVKGNSDYYYVVRGNYDNLFVRYDSSSGEAVRMADAPAGFYIGASFAYDSTQNKIYASTSLYNARLYVYDIATDTWSEEASDPFPFDPNSGSSLTYDGSRYLYWARGAGTVNFYRYDTQASAGSRWTSRANVTGGLNYGSRLVYKGGYVYTLRGGNTTTFYRYDPTGNSWSTLTSIGANVYNDGFMVDGGSDSLYACRGGNQSGCYMYSISGNSWTAIADAPAHIYQGGSGASNGTDKMFVIAGNGTNTYANGLYEYVIQSSTSSFEETGTFISQSHDFSSVYKWANLQVNYTSATNNTLTVYTRSSSDESTWTSWVEAGETSRVGTTSTYEINSNPNRYIQVKFSLSSIDGVYSDVIDSYSFLLYQDTVNPTNPSSLTAYSTSTQSAELTTNTWYNYTAPYFDWPDADEAGGATDTATGSGVLGYYVYFGTDSTADPLSDGTYATSSAYTASGLSSGNTYYLRLKTKDDAGNASSSTWQPFIYKFDNTAPTNPTTIVVNPPGYTSANSFDFTWSGATDSASMVSEYCYKTGASDATDTCTSVASASAVLSYQTGTNTFYVRAKDTAGNYASDYASASYYYNSTAPSPPRNLAVSPSSNTVNEFSFTWEPPVTYYGSQSDLRYYYSINELPKSSNVNKTGLSSSYLSADAYATKKGINTLYVVAKDGAGNIDYNLYASVEFTADTSAPGVPLNPDMSDVSIKETKNWKLAITWDPPTASGSGIANYKVYRSATTDASCSTNFSDFSYVASTIQTSFVDSELTQQTHYYCVKACDSTNECSAASDTVSLYPDGKWRVAPDMIATTSATVKTRTATIAWSTNRSSNSFVKYGKKSGDYGDEVGSSEQVTYHEIKLSGLDPGTQYYYKMLWTDEDGNTGSSEEQTFETQPAPFISDVKLTSVSINNAYVTFKIKNAIKASVKYGKTVSYGATEVLSTSKSESTYTIQLTNLLDATAYHLQVVGEDEEGNVYSGDDYTFETLPVPKIINLKVQQVAGTATATLRLLWSSNTKISTIVTYYPKDTPSQAKDYIALALTQNHEVILKDLVDDTDYVVSVRGKDLAGNEATTPSPIIKTAVDFRPPEVINLNVESTIIGVGEQARAQIIVSWDTDEAATTQVEYDEGTTSSYSHTTQEDTNLTKNHVVTIPGLLPSKIYHLRVVSKDKANNIGYSPDTVIITPKSTQDALNLVIDNLSKTFGFLKSISSK